MQTISLSRRHKSSLATTGLTNSASSFVCAVRLCKNNFLAKINIYSIYPFSHRKITRRRVLSADSSAAGNRGTITLSLLITVVTVVVLLPEMDRSDCSSYLLREEERDRRGVAAGLREAAGQAVCFV